MLPLTQNLVIKQLFQGYNLNSLTCGPGPWPVRTYSVILGKQFVNPILLNIYTVNVLHLHIVQVLLTTIPRQRQVSTSSTASLPSSPSNKSILAVG